MPEITLYTTGFCAPCRAARQVLDYAGRSVRVTVTEINAADHPGDAERAGITSTPTMIAFDGGVETWRYVGVPRLAELTAALKNL